MDTAKPILRVGKIKKAGRSTLGSVSGHLLRSRPTPNADPARTGRNEWLIGGGEDLAQRVESFMTKLGLDPTKTRKDAVVANDILLTVSPEWFRPADPSAGGTWDEDRLASFKAEAEQMLRKTFGTRCVAAVLHLDEATPHVQAVVVPVMKGEKGLKLSSKDMFGPKQLTQLQQDWEDRMQPHGVGPREKRSKAKHTTLREYYGALEEFARGEDDRAKIRLAEPPRKGLFQSKADHDAKVSEWRRDEAKRLRKELRPMAAAAAKGRLFASEKRLRTNDQAKARFDRDRLTQIAEELDLTKEQIARFRAVPIHEAAIALGHTDPIGPKENAIDLTMRVGELNYRQATAWLAQTFGQDAAASTVREKALEALQEPQKRVYTAGERVKARIVKEQLLALSAPSYRITAMFDTAEGDRKAVNVGKALRAKDHLTQGEVLELIPELTRYNARGGNIFVTPIDDAAQHILVDDMTMETMAQMLSKGYAPALLQQSSPNSIQAVLKVPLKEGSKADRNEAFKDLNRAYGDEKITGLVHPFRLAGFENRKEKHRNEDGKFPFVRIVEAVNRFCGKAVGLVREYQERREAIEAAQRAEEKRRLAQERSEESTYRGPRLG